ncbi:MAG: hypothetical protein AB8G95_07185 [Anaerolineae bacterium]
MKNINKSLWVSSIISIGFIGLVFSVTYSQTEKELDFFAYLPFIQREANTPEPPANITVTVPLTVTSTIAPLETVIFTPTSSIEPTAPLSPTIVTEETPKPSIPPSLTPLPIFTPVLSTTLTPIYAPTATQTAHPTAVSTMATPSTPIPTNMPVQTNTPNLTPVNTPILTSTQTLIPTVVLTVAPTSTPTLTNTPAQTITPTLAPVNTPTLTATHTLTPTAVLTMAPASTSTPTPTNTPAQTSTPTLTPVHTPVLTNTQTLTPTAIPTIAPTPNGPPTFQLKSIKQISIGLNGEPINSSASYPLMSANGKYIAFHSNASNLTANDTNNNFDVFLYDVENSQLKLISIANDGTQSNGYSGYSQISADGKFVLFNSHATNLAASATADGIQHIYLYDVAADSISLITKNSAGDDANGDSFYSELSADGRFITFTSEATNLTDDSYANDTARVFLLDRLTNEIKLITKSVQAEPLTRPSTHPDISRDGRYIVYRSFSNKLTDDDSNGEYDIFLYDRETEVTQKISKHNDGTQGNSNSDYPRFSGDDKYIYFMSHASNLVDMDTNNQVDVFIFDMENSQLSRLFIDTANIQPNFSSSFYSSPINSQFVFFSSHATNLVSGDTNQAPDIFFHDLNSGDLRRLSLTGSGGQSNGRSYQPTISDNYKFLVFHSSASNLLEDAEPHFTDNIFLYEYH